MNSQHLTEAEIVDYALGSADLNLAEHIRACPVCNSKVLNYRVIFTMMDELPEPALDLDVQKLVMGCLPTPDIRASKEHWVYIAACFALALLIVPIYLNIDNLLRMINGLGRITLYLVLITTLAALILNIGDMYRKYLKKMKALT